jgi:phosphoglycolate phosphatase-like HAD superfamily hydrolase
VKSVLHFSQKKDYLALDFDGVIADSIKECFVVAHNAFVEFSGAGLRVDFFDDLDQEKVAKMRRIRNFIRSGEDYVYICLAIYKNAVIQNQKDFDSFTEQYKYLRATFFEEFYRERRRFSHEKPGLWAELNPLYPGIRHFLATYKQADRLLIISTKKAEFVDKTLTANDIHFNTNRIFYATAHRSKRTIIEELLDQNKIQPDQFHFIDDQIDTLLTVAETGVSCYLALWGYNNEGQIETARRRGISTLELEDFLEIFSVF